MRRLFDLFNLSRKSLRKAARVIAFIVGLGILFFLGRTVVLGWEEIQQYDWHFNYGLLSLSLLLLLGNTLQQSVILHAVLRKLGHRLPFRYVFRMLSLSTLGSYLPGRFWSYAGLAYLGKRRSVSVVSSGIGIVTVMATSSVGGAILSLLVGYRYLGAYVILAALVVIPLLLLILHPTVIKWVVSRLPERWVKSKSPIPLSFGSILSLVGWQAFSWTLQGLHLALLALSVWPLSAGDFVLVIGVAPAAWLVGYYTLVAPGGLGVKEGVAAFLLSAYMPFPFAAGIALMSQLALTLIQVLCALVALRIN